MKLTVKSIPLDKTPVTFGKHHGKTPGEIAVYDPGYIIWMYENVEPLRCSRELYLAAVDQHEEEKAEKYSDDPFYNHEDGRNGGW